MDRARPPPAAGGGAPMEVVYPIAPTAGGGSVAGRGDSFFVGAGVLCIGAFALYSTWRGSCRGSPQLLWAKEGRRPPATEKNSTEEAVVIEKKTKPRMFLVNFPEGLRWKFQQCLRPLIDIDELDLVDASVVFYHDSSELTPGNVVSVVRGEVLTAFDELGCRPCVVYRSAVAIDGEAVNPFWSEKHAADASRGGLFHERHCIGYTVDGSRVEVLEHNVYGEISTTVSPSVFTRAKTPYGLGNLGAVLRDCVCVTSSTFCGVKTSGHRNGEHSKFSALGNSHGDSCSSFLRVSWLGPAPLFAFFAAALRFSRLEFDGWHHLLERQSSFRLLPWLRGLFARGAHKGGGPIGSGRGAGEEQPDRLLLLEIAVKQNVLSLCEAHYEAIRESLMRAGRSEGCDESGVLQMGDAGRKVGVEVSPASQGAGSFVRCRFPSTLTVFPALYELWRTVSLVAHLNYDVLSFRLLVPVGIGCSASVESRAVNSGKTGEAVPAFPRSQEEVEAYPSFFCSSQYFCTLPEEPLVKSEEAFKRIREGDTRGLHYVIVEYLASSLTL